MINGKCMDDDKCWTVMELIEHKQINAPNFMTGLSNIHHPKS
jgi:hypothetical protein